MSTIKEKADMIIEWIATYFEKNNVKKAVVGLSGGVDSSLVAALTAKAIGKENVLGLFLPHGETTSDESSEYAQLTAKAIGIDAVAVDITGMVEALKEAGSSLVQGVSSQTQNLSLGNAKARARMMMQYYYANLHGAVVMGTANKSEALLGFATKHGDAAADVFPIIDLWKTDVWEMARLMGVPEEVVKRKPTPELIMGVCDEDEIGAPYETVDEIFKAHLEKGMTEDELCSEYGHELVSSLFARMKANKHKTNAVVMKFS